MAADTGQNRYHAILLQAAARPDRLTIGLGGLQRFLPAQEPLHIGGRLVVLDVVLEFRPKDFNLVSA